VVALDAQWWRMTVVECCSGDLQAEAEAKGHLLHMSATDAQRAPISTSARRRDKATERTPSSTLAPAMGLAGTALRG
jgi:hypothetical protein